MKTKMILGAACLALASCDGAGKDGEGNGSAGGGRAAAGSVQLQPGEWEMKAEVVSVKAEGLPPGATESMKQAASRTSRDCMTAEDAKGPKAENLAPNPPGGNCKSENYSWGGGRISGKTSCTAPGGVKTTVVMDGRYDAQSMDITMKSDSDVAGRAMQMEMRISGRRVGECKAAAKEG